MNNIWFISDTHFGHYNVIKYCNRPFKSVDEMDNELIKRWNNKVDKGDTVYHLGDFGFIQPVRWKEIVRQLNGQIHLIKGNHDKQIPRDLFASVSDIKEIRIKDSDSPHGWQYLILCHYAMRVWNKSHYGAWHLYGHSHGTLENDPKSLSIDVGVDTNNYYPYSYEDVKVAMFQKNYEPVDHHNGGRL